MEALLAGSGPDSWALASAAATALGAQEDAALFAREARRRAGRSAWEGPHRAELLTGE